MNRPMTDEEKSIVIDALTYRAGSFRRAARMTGGSLRETKDKLVAKADKLENVRARFAYDEVTFS